MPDSVLEKLGRYKIMTGVGRGGFAPAPIPAWSALPGKDIVGLFDSPHGHKPMVSLYRRSDPANENLPTVYWKWVAGIGAVVVIIVAFVIALLSGCRPTAPPDMVYVPAGEFTMGSDEGQPDEQPVHTIYLNAFYMDRTEVTNAQFTQFLNEQGNREEGGVIWLDIGDEDCLITQSGWQYQPKSGYSDLPVVEVSWYGARAYCQWADKRLPTEAEWEKAARGTDGRTYPWGEGIDCDRAQYRACGGRTVPVGSKPKGASPYGALDMAGNVWEWVADWYGSGYYATLPQSNPQGPASGDYRVFRGGAWRNSEVGVRAAYRYWDTPDDTHGNLGFRCAR